ncbi:hypothetical protein [Pseudogemmobacter sonorensis]|uniref:hypothetical protein n=1 Tax=Pseudogemmobacter sonorensis TaxID=2989681 RepID=UPI00368B53B5
MAAVETIRRGYERFIILGMGGSSDVSVIPGRVTGAHTSANASIYGNNAYGMATTTYTSTPPMIIGGHDSSLDVLMLKKGDRNFGDGIDAKRELGDNWASIVKNGIQACT